MVLRRPHILILRLAMAAGGAATAACSNQKPAPNNSSAPAASTPACSSPAAVSVDPDFGPGSQILNGFELATSAEHWQPGDRVLLGLRIQKHRATTVRFLLVELTNKSSTGSFEWSQSSSKPDNKQTINHSTALAVTRISLYDEHAQLLQEAEGNFGIKLLGRGLFDATDPIADQSETPDLSEQFAKLPDEQRERISYGWASLMAFSFSLGKPGMFKELLSGVVAKPSLLSLLFNRSASLGSVGMPKHEGAWQPANGRDFPIVSTRLLLRISGTDSLVGDVKAVRPVAPLSLCGGIIAADATRPDDPDQHITVRLLASSLGSGNPAHLLFVDRFADNGYQLKQDAATGNWEFEEKPEPPEPQTKP